MTDNKAYSSFGFGRRTLFGALQCENSDNLLFSDDMKEFLRDAENGEIITVSDGLIRISANGKKYVKWLAVKPHTWYFLSFSGRTGCPVWTDLNFGIMGTDRLPFKNLHTKKEESFFVHKYALDQMITVKGQDGEWYARNYLFHTGDTDKVGFFADGSEGCVEFQKLLICEANNAGNTERRKESTVLNWSDDICDCLPEHNFAGNVEVFESGENYGDFIEIRDKSLKYLAKNRSYYYFAWLPVEENRLYIFSYSHAVNKSGNAVYGFMVQKPDGKRKWLFNNSAKTEHSEQTVSNFVSVVKGDKIAFAFFDGGGEVEISNIKVFKIGHGIANSE